MASLGTASLEVRIDRAGLNREINAAGRQVESGFQKASRQVSTILAGAVALGFTKSAIDAASNLTEAQTKANVVFGEGVDAVNAFGEEAAAAFGQSERQALEAAGTFGNLFDSIGLNEQQVSEFSVTLTKLASDLASFNNTTVDDALMALRSGLVGETEPLKRFGINLNEATLKAKALALGIADGTAVLTPAQKAQAAYALILEQSSNAQGDFARTSEGLANQQRITAAEFENAKAKLGQALVPTMLSATKVAAGLATGFAAQGPVLIQAELAALAAGIAYAKLAAPIASAVRASSAFVEATSATIAAHRGAATAAGAAAVAEAERATIAAAAAQEVALANTAALASVEALAVVETEAVAVAAGRATAEAALGEAITAGTFAETANTQAIAAGSASRQVAIALEAQRAAAAVALGEAITAASFAENAETAALTANTDATAANAVVTGELAVAETGATVASTRLATAQTTAAASSARFAGAMSTAGIAAIAFGGSFALTTAALNKLSDAQRDVKGSTDDLALAFLAGNKSAEASKLLLDTFGKDFEKLVSRIDLADVSTADRWTSILGAGQIKAAREDLDVFDKSMAELVAGGHADEAETQVMGFVSAAMASGASAAKAGQFLDDYWKAVDKAAISSAAADDSTGGLADGVGDVGDAADTAAAELEAYQATVERVRAAGLAQVDAIVANQQGQRELAAATQASTDAVAEYQKGLQVAEVDTTRLTDAIDAVSDANRAYVDAQKGVQDALRGVEDAHDGVIDALRGVEDANRGVVDAEEAVADAQRGAEDAQRSLTGARVEAKKALDELKRSARGDDLSVEGAEIRLLRARQALATRDEGEDALDQREERLSVAQAELALEEARRRAADSQEELTAAEAAGVEGSDEVIAAKEGIADAEDAVIEAQRRQQDANDAVVEAQGRVVDAQRAVVDANDRVVEAQEKVADTLAAIGEAEANVGTTRREIAEETAAAAQQGADDYEAAGAAVIAEADRVAQAVATQGIAMLEEAGHTVTAADKAALLASGYQSVADKLDPNAPLRKQLEGYIADLLKTPGSKETDFTQPGMKEGLENSAELRKRLGEIPEDSETEFDQPGMPKALEDSAELRKRLGDLPAEHETVVTLPFIAEREKEAEELQRKLGEILPEYRTTVTIDSFLANAELDRLQDRLRLFAATGLFLNPTLGSAVPRAEGGTVPEGWATVGERGWELLYKHGTRVDVFSHEKSKRLTGAPDRLPGFAAGTAGSGLAADTLAASALHLADALEAAAQAAEVQRVTEPRQDVTESETIERLVSSTDALVESTERTETELRSVAESLTSVSESTSERSETATTDRTATTDTRDRQTTTDLTALAETASELRTEITDTFATVDRQIVERVTTAFDRLVTASTERLVERDRGPERTTVDRGPERTTDRTTESVDRLVATLTDRLTERTTDRTTERADVERLVTEAVSDTLRAETGATDRQVAELVQLVDRSTSTASTVERELVDRLVTAVSDSTTDRSDVERSISALVSAVERTEATATERVSTSTDSTDRLVTVLRSAVDRVTERTATTDTTRDVAETERSQQATTDRLVESNNRLESTYRSVAETFTDAEREVTTALTSTEAKVIADQTRNPEPALAAQLQGVAALSAQDPAVAEFMQIAAAEPEGSPLLAFFEQVAAGPQQVRGELVRDDPQLVGQVDDSEARRQVTETLDSVTRRVEEVTAELVGFPDHLTVDLVIPDDLKALLDWKPEGRAGGGPVTAGQPYLVGEHGRAELFVPEVDGTVLTAAPTAQGHTLHQTNHFHPGVDEQQISRDMEWQFRRFRQR